MASSDAILSTLYQRTTGAIKLGLERIESAACEVGTPQRAYQSIHVAGTNGKGAVCTFLASALSNAGYKTGLYLSPHLVHFEERFLINGRPVAMGDWENAYSKVEPLVEKYELTFFEITTLLAFLIFKEAGVDWAVIETGLGGRLDATNVVIPEASVITRLGLDHARYLGNDLYSVAREKLGIVKQSIPLIMLDPANPEIRRLAIETVKARSTRVDWVGLEPNHRTETTEGTSRFRFRGAEVTVPLFGHHQASNALLAMTVLDNLGIGDTFSNAQALASVRLPGRLQKVTRNGRTWIFDVGHNPQAVEALTETLVTLYPNQRILFVVGVMADKDVHAIMEKISECATEIVAVRPSVARAIDSDALLRCVPDSFEGETVSKETVPEGMAVAEHSAAEVVCVCGSFFTVGEAMTVCGIHPYDL